MRPILLIMWTAFQSFILRDNNNNNKPAAYLHWSICKDHDIEITDKCYEHKPETVMHNKDNNITIMLAEVRKFRGDRWIATTTGIVPFLSQTEKMAGVLLLVSEFIEEDFEVLNDIVKDDDDIVKENELFEE